MNYWKKEKKGKEKVVKEQKPRTREGGGFGIISL
jgi:hypothetical protein